MTDDPTPRDPRPRRPDSRTDPREQIRALGQWRRRTDDAGAADATRQSDGWRHETAEIPRVTDDIPSADRAGDHAGRMTRTRRRVPLAAVAGLAVLAVVGIGVVGSAVSASTDPTTTDSTTTDPTTTDGSAGAGQGPAVPDISSSPAPTPVATDTSPGTTDTSPGTTDTGADTADDPTGPRSTLAAPDDPAQAAVPLPGDPDTGGGPPDGPGPGGPGRAGAPGGAGQHDGSPERRR